MLLVKEKAYHNFAARPVPPYLFLYVVVVVVSSSSVASFVPSLLVKSSPCFHGDVFVVVVVVQGRHDN